MEARTLAELAEKMRQVEDSVEQSKQEEAQRLDLSLQQVCEAQSTASSLTQATGIKLITQERLVLGVLRY